MLTSPPAAPNNNENADSDVDVELKKVINEWEFKLTSENLLENNDPISLYEQYYNILLAIERKKNENYKFLDNVITTLLEKVTKLFVNDKRYKQDSRYLGMWIAYSYKCIEPLNIFSFLGSQGIGSNLSSFYEEYSSLLQTSSPLLALQILENGIRRDAEPLERLKKNCRKFIESNPNISPSKDILNILGLSLKKRKIERISYVPPVDEDGLPISFEEARSRQWRNEYHILSQIDRQTLAPVLPPSSNMDDEYEGNLLPDDDNLTNITIYKDNTTDLRELAEAMRRQQHQQHPLDSITDFPLQMLSSPLPPPQMNGLNLKIKNNIFQNFDYDDDSSSTLVGGIRLSLVPKEFYNEIFVSDFINYCDLTFDDSFPLIRMMIPSFSFFPLEKGSSFEVGNYNYWVEDCIKLWKAKNNNEVSSSILTGMEIKDSDTTGDMKIILIKFSDGKEPLVEAKLLSMMLLNPLLYPRIPTPLRVYHINENIIMHTQSLIRHSMSIRSYLNREEANTIKDDKLLFFWLREILFFIKCLLSSSPKPIVHGLMGLDNVMIRIGSSCSSPNDESEGPLSVEFSPIGLNGWNSRGISVISWGKGRFFNIDTFDGDVIIRKEGTGEQVLLGDVSMFLINIMEIRTALNSNTFKNIDVNVNVNDNLPFKALQEGIEDLLGGAAGAAADNNQRGGLPRSLGMILDHLSSLISMMDKVLIEQSTKRPTLKSLLTKLEISLLE